MEVERRAQESRRERRKIHERRALRRDDEIRQHVDAAVEERVDIPLHAAQDILHIHARIAREHLHVVRHRLVELRVSRPTRFVLRDIRQADAQDRPPRRLGRARPQARRQSGRSCKKRQPQLSIPSHKHIPLRPPHETFVGRCSQMTYMLMIRRKPPDFLLVS